MSLSTCKVLTTARSERVILISRSLSKALQLEPTRTVTVTVGSKTVTAPLRLISTGGNTIVLSTSLAAALHLVWSGNCMVKSSGHELQLGPLVGLLTTVTGNPEQPFGARSHFVREFLHAAEGKAIVCAFSPNGVDWQQETISAYFLGAGGGWIRRTMPLPDVVYNRLPSRSAEKSLAIQTFKERFVRRRIPLFNWSFFDKSDVYRLLDGEQEANRYVPESYYSPTSEQIQQMIEKHNFVYLKPTSGSLGIGIYRLTYNPGKGYFARFRRGGSNMLIRFPRFEGLMKMLQRHGLRLQNYVVQQGIRLIEQDNCPIDFRFHMTKNGQNEWVAAGIGAKKAGRGSVTTHGRTGGQLLTPEQVLGRVFGSRAEQVLQNAKNVAVKLAEAIEKNYPHSLAELGFDIGIDQNERVWMFEANAKPGRSIFKHPSLKPQGKATIVNLVEHALYLSRFRSRRDG